MRPAACAAQRRWLLRLIMHHSACLASRRAAPQVRTVQGELEKAVSRVLMPASRCVGASRTDGGAHALGQVRRTGPRALRAAAGGWVGYGAAVHLSFLA